MSSGPRQRTARLARWRGLQELEAQTRYIGEAAMAAERSRSLEQVEQLVSELAGERDRQLDAGELDMVRLGLIDSLEHDARELRARREIELEEATQRKEQSMLAYVEARSKTRVVRSRHERIVHDEALTEEKRISDHSADMVAARRTR